MKKLLLIFVLYVMHMSCTWAQSGVASCEFVAKTISGTEHPCTAGINFKDGHPVSMSLIEYVDNKQQYMLACIQDSATRQNRYKTVEQRINDFRDVLVKVLDKYKEWSATAKANNVKSFKKAIGIYSEVPLMYMDYVDGDKKYMSSSTWPPIHESGAMFIVDDKGRCFVKFYLVNGLTLTRTVAYSSKGFMGMVKAPITEDVKVDYNIFFDTEEKIQKLIDFLDLEKAKASLNQKQTERQKVDELFK